MLSLSISTLRPAAQHQAGARPHGFVVLPVVAGRAQQVLASALCGLRCEPMSGKGVARATTQGTLTGFVTRAVKRQRSGDGDDGDDVPSSSPKLARPSASQGSAEDASHAGHGPARPRSLGLLPTPVRVVDGKVARLSSPRGAESLDGDVPAAPAMLPMPAAEAPPAAGPGLADLLTEPSWRERLQSEFAQPYFSRLDAFLRTEPPSKVFPPRPSVFRAFEACPFDRVRVVLLGQDPYHARGQAVGLCFAVPRGVAIPSSLQNIYKEIQADVGCPRPRHGDLGKWAAQGVFLLNTSLTVREGQAGSHAKRGWEEFTDAAIRALSQQRSGLVFLLWGKHAQGKLKLIDQSRHVVLQAAHPSGLSAHKGFFGCRHFSRTNEALKRQGLPPIDWCLDP